MPNNHRDIRNRLARIELLIEHYRLARMLRQQKRAITLWRRLEARQVIVEFEKPLERIH